MSDDTGRLWLTDEEGVEIRQRMAEIQESHERNLAAMQAQVDRAIGETAAIVAELRQVVVELAERGRGVTIHDGEVTIGAQRFRVTLQLEMAALS